MARIIYSQDVDRMLDYPITHSPFRHASCVSVQTGRERALRIGSERTVRKEKCEHDGGKGIHRYEGEGSGWVRRGADSLDPGQSQGSDHRQGRDAELRSRVSL